MVQSGRLTQELLGNQVTPHCQASMSPPAVFFKSNQQFDNPSTNKLFIFGFTLVSFPFFISFIQLKSCDMRLKKELKYHQLTWGSSLRYIRRGSTTFFSGLFIQHVLYLCLSVTYMLIYTRIYIYSIYCGFLSHSGINSVCPQAQILDSISLWKSAWRPSWFS